MPRIRALAHGIAATFAVVVACAIVGITSALSYRDNVTELQALVGRMNGSIHRVNMDRIAVLLNGIGRAQSGLVFTSLVVTTVLLVGCWRVMASAPRRRRGTNSVLARRIRVQRGLICRSWLETDTEPQHWIPVYFDPALVELPAPTEVLVRGDLRRHRTVTVDIQIGDGQHTLYPSGRSTTAAPPGRRTDNPSRPDEYAAARASSAASPLRQLRVDAALLVPAPVLGLLWTYVDGGGFSDWLAASAIAATVGMWWAALRGSDPC